jgi:hypothetical protein
MKERELFQTLETGKAVTMTYLHINNKTSKVVNMDFGQNIEISGEYMTFNDHQYKVADNSFIYGTIQFNNPLVIEYVSTDSFGWKKTLSEMFNNKKKKALSNAVLKAGYDAIITIDSEYKEVKEIVNLKGVKVN